MRAFDDLVHQGNKEMVKNLVYGGLRDKFDV